MYKYVVSFDRKVLLMEQELLTLPEHLSSSPVFIGVRVNLSLVLCVMFCRLLFDLSSLCMWLLCCLTFFDLRILLTTLVSSNSSYYACTLFMRILQLHSRNKSNETFEYTKKCNYKLYIEKKGQTIP